MEKDVISKEWLKTFQTLNENQKRWFAATKSFELGYGGISKVSQATGLSRTTITQGRNELLGDDNLFSNNNEHQRKLGGGRKKISISKKEIIRETEKILSESSAGDPMSKLKWTCKSTRKIAEILSSKGYPVSNVTVMNILKEQGYSLRSNKKMLSGRNHPDRDAQFNYINHMALNL